jgi:outer membrane protein assembly factor BamE (lipoprotein component of BamABCDE complex)
MAMSGRTCFTYILLLAILVIVAAQLALFLIGWGRDNNYTHEQNEQQKLLTREEFKQLILGKTEDEVLAAAGKPSSTSQADDATYWHYADRTRDPVTGEADSDVQVVFKHGRVAVVNF